MNEVIEKLCRIKTQYAINKLNPSSTDMIFIQYEELCLELNNQLQSYKDIRNKAIVLTNKIIDKGWDYVEKDNIAFELRKILKGDDKNE